MIEEPDNLLRALEAALFAAETAMTADELKTVIGWAATCSRAVLPRASN